MSFPIISGQRLCPYHFKKRSDSDLLLQVTGSYDPKRIHQTIRAMEMYTLMASIVMGIFEALSIDFSNSIFTQSLRYQRTYVKGKPLRPT